MSEPAGIIRYGSAVLLQGEIRSALLRVLPLGIEAATRRDAAIPSSLFVLRSQLARAIAADGKKDAAPVPSPAGSGVEVLASEVAVRAGLRPRTVRHLAMTGQIAATKRAGTWFFDQAAVDEYLRRREQR